MTDLNKDHVDEETYFHVKVREMDQYGEERGRDYDYPLGRIDRYETVGSTQLFILFNDDSFVVHNLRYVEQFWRDQA